MRIPVPWVFVIAYCVGLLPQAYVPIELPPATRHLVRIAGFILLPAGVALAAWSLTIFRGQGTTTIPGEQSRALVTWGPYRFSRNPMYVGMVAMMLGLGVATGVPFMAIAALNFVAIVGAVHVPFEEAQMQRAFGGWYSDYSASVRRWL
jgi:protein-S-isoprenylcysteine O-methyltransferase Ste14